MGRITHVDTLTGTGHLEAPGKDTEIPVRYTLNVFRDSIAVDGGTEIGSELIDGWVDVEDKFLLYGVKGQLLVLHLSDRRLLDVTLSDTDGRITATGTFRPAQTD
jgi:hypothetical protein